MQVTVFPIDQAPHGAFPLLGQASEVFFSQSISPIRFSIHLPVTEQEPGDLVVDV